MTHEKQPTGKPANTVPVRDLLHSSAFRDHPSEVAFAVGKDAEGNAVVGNIATLPHLLIAGAAGSGKTMSIKSLITSLLCKAKAKEVRLILADTKNKLGVFHDTPHLLTSVITDPGKAVDALRWAVDEMMRRYRTFSEAGVRDLKSYNDKAAMAEGMELLPRVVVVIDELADLMQTAAADVEEAICRVAQMGRGVGIHLVIATQSVSRDVITGPVRASIPSRIAFAVSSSAESRIILDAAGAEKLSGKGDMLFSPLGAQKPARVQGCFVSDEEIEAVVNRAKQSGGTGDQTENL